MSNNKEQPMAVTEVIFISKNMNQIKQLQPKEGVTLLAVLLPKGCEAVRVERGNMLIVNQDHRPEYSDYMFLPECNWQLLGIAADVPEEVWQGIMPSMEYYDPEDAELCEDDYEPEILYMDFKHKRLSKNEYRRISATESAKSFLEANEVYSINPWAIAYQFDQCSAYQYRRAEANTGAWVILKKEETQPTDTNVGQSE